MNTPVKFEIAKSLKEKGFDEECRYYYDTEFKERTWHMEYEPFKNSEIENGYNKLKYPMISAPTIAEVVMWLYEKHGIWIFILPQDKSSVDFRVESSEFPSLPLFILIVKYEQDLSMTEVLNSSNSNSNMFLHFDEPTEAYEAAIEYCLKNLI
jgi:hypothetical protein